MAFITNTNDYADLEVTFDYTGQSQTLGIEAIKQNIKLYLWSTQGDYGRSIKKGGILFDMIGKQLSDSNAKLLKSKIEEGLKAFKYVVINNIDVRIDVENKRFVVSIVFSDTYNKFISDIKFAVASEGST